MTNHLVAQDMASILNCLHDGPKTCKEVADTLRLTYRRVNALLLELAKKQTIHAPRCALSAKGSSVNLWELKTPKEESS